MNSTDRRSGFSLVEVMAALIILSVGMVGVSSLLVINSSSALMAEQDATATNALRAMAERIRSAPFEAAAGTYGNYEFEVAGIDGVGSVQVFLDENDGSADARALGFPRDLDGDGAVGTADVSGTYRLLPIRLELRWDRAHGEEVRQLSFLLAAND